ncbi:MAG: hypothetical protein MUF49_14460 [Oculatellaceae cyanobacterium Prado106]|nr:hypothetical protein [Oculatellaceae cyanobacterium Prado106]
MLNAELGNAIAVDGKLSLSDLIGELGVFEFYSEAAIVVILINIGGLTLEPQEKTTGGDADFFEAGIFSGDRTWRNQQRQKGKEARKKGKTGKKPVFTHECETSLVLTIGISIKLIRSKIQEPSVLFGKKQGQTGLNQILLCLILDLILRLIFYDCFTAILLP